MIYDLAIIGVGPAAMSASIYASRYRVKNVLLGTELGGQMSKAISIENYPGIERISGLELAQKMKDHVLVYDDTADLDITTVENIEKKGEIFEIMTPGRTVQAKTILFASGMKRRKLRVEGEDFLTGRGVGYCVTCDGFFFKGKRVAVVGGGNAAITGALMLSGIAAEVFVVMIEKEPIAEPYWVDKLREQKNVTFISENRITKINGQQKVESVSLDKPYQDSKELALDGIFIEIGATPDPVLPRKLGVELTEGDKIKINPDGSTNVPGIYAAGAVTNGSNNFDQVVTAISEGAIAANSIYEYLQKKESVENS